MQVTKSNQPDEPVAKVLALDQHENHKNDDQTCRCKRADKRKNEIAKCLDRMGSCDDFNGHRLSHGWCGRLLVLISFDGACLQLGADTLDNLAQMFEHTIA